MKKLLLAAAACSLFGGYASAAVTFTTTVGGAPNAAADPGFAPNLNLIYDFETAPVATGSFETPAAPGTPGVTAAPAGTTAGEKYFSVPVAGDITKTATLSLGGVYKYVSFYWGSIDDYNTLELLDAGNNVLATISGLALLPANGDQSSQVTNRRINLSSDAVNVASLRLTSTSQAFEIDTVAAAVPEPATWAMMLGGFGLLGAAMRRRATVKTVIA